MARINLGEKMWLTWAALYGVFVLVPMLMQMPSMGHASVLTPPAYNLVQNKGTPLAQRTTINCATGMTCTDTGGVTQLSATGTGGSVTEVNLTVSAPLAKAGTCDITTSGTCNFALSANNQIRSFGGSFDGSGVALTAGKTTYVTVPFACTISAFNILVDTGTASFDVWKIATGTAIPTVTNSILSGGFLSISSGTALHSTTLTRFTTTTVTANDIVGVNLQAVASATFAQIVIECDATS